MGSTGKIVVRSCIKVAPPRVLAVLYDVPSGEVVGAVADEGVIPLPRVNEVVLKYQLVKEGLSNEEEEEEEDGQGQGQGAHPKQT